MSAEGTSTRCQLAPQTQVGGSWESELDGVQEELQSFFRDAVELTLPTQVMLHDIRELKPVSTLCKGVYSGEGLLFNNLFHLGYHTGTMVRGGVCFFTSAARGKANSMTSRLRGEPDLQVDFCFGTFKLNVRRPTWGMLGGTECERVECTHRGVGRVFCKVGLAHFHSLEVGDEGSETQAVAGPGAVENAYFRWASDTIPLLEGGSAHSREILRNAEGEIIYHEGPRREGDDVVLV